LPGDFEYVDVHCHLDDESFDRDRDEVVARARGVLILCASQDPKSSRKVLSLARRYPSLRACLGLHPEFVPNLTDGDVEQEIDFIASSAGSIVAISEIGLDYHRIKGDVQRGRIRDVFHMMLDLATRLKLPIIVHSRDATGDVLREVSQFKYPVILHSFPGDSEEIEIVISRGHYLSVAPSIYRSKQKQELVRMAPLDLLLTESDSPVLGIDRKERNEPASVSKVIAMIAEIKAEDEPQVRKALMENFYRIFPNERT
jgi:TatD DNase family protein